MQKLFIAIMVVMLASCGAPPTLPPCDLPKGISAPIHVASNTAIEAATTAQTKDYPLYVLSDKEKRENCEKVVEKYIDTARGDFKKSPTKEDMTALWKMFNDQIYSDPKRGSRKLMIFHDGTSNTGDKFTKSTSIWKLYLRAVRHACEQPIIPYYHTGIGTLFGNRLLGQAMGLGMDRHIKDDYTFLVETYRPGDKIFIFGFSRGAYIARALNGMIEFAGLLNKDSLTEDNDDLAGTVDKLYKFYHQTNDGAPKFDDRLRCHITREMNEDEYMQGIELYTSEKNRLFAEKNQKAEGIKLTVPHRESPFLVSAIGVFDTVPAYGADRDDYPDDYRVELYANEGYHALSLDEQRHDFRPLRFDQAAILLGKQTLREVWFAGDHSDVGGGYLDKIDGLERVSRQWLKRQLAPHNIFPPKPRNGLNCGHASNGTQQQCELDQLHDGFLDSKQNFMGLIYGTTGLHWRKPQPNDLLHKSVICRINAQKLPKPHQVAEGGISREVGGVYRPTNLYPCLAQCYRIEDHDSYTCLDGNDAMPAMAPYSCDGGDSYQTICPGLSAMR